ncbi:MAG: DUF4349 domain-containing protein [bacterium]
MRKHSYPLARRSAIAGVLLAFVFTACNRSRDERSITAQSADASAPMVNTGEIKKAHVFGRATAGGADVPAERALAAPAMSPAPAPNAPTSAEKSADLNFGTGSATAPGLSGAMLVRHGQASLEVKHVEDALALARQAAAQFGGFVGNTAVRNGKDEQPSATLEIRVPSAQFDALVGSLGSLGKVETVTASVEDVGEEFVDMGARAANARRTEARLTEMLASRTGKLSDVLTVEQELRRVREEIERYDARLRFLEQHASVSTLDITLHQPFALIDRPRPGPIVEALGIAWERTLGVIAWCIASLGLIIPLGVLIGLGVAIARRFNWPQLPGKAGNATVIPQE